MVLARREWPILQRERSRQRAYSKWRRTPSGPTKIEASFGFVYCASSDHSSPRFVSRSVPGPEALSSRDALPPQPL